MTTRLACVSVLSWMALVGCGSDSATPAEMLEGDWVFADTANNQGVGLTFEDNRYVFSVLSVLSSTSANVEIEKGTFTATASQITFVPTEYTCAGPVPVYVLDYGFSGANLVITGGTKLISFERNDSAGGGSFAINLGCFTSTGFVSSPLAPVSN